MIKAKKAVFDGRKLAAKKERSLVQEVAGFKKKFGIVPELVAFVVGKSAASELYLRKKTEAGKRVGIKVEVVRLDESIELNELVGLIKKKNRDFKTHGIMIQLPLPKKFNARHSLFNILKSIDSSKDVDCLTPENLGLLAMDKVHFFPATVKAILEIIRNSKFKIHNSKITVVGGSNIVGKPLVFQLANLGGSILWCPVKTENLAELTRQADLLISATGVPNLIKADMVKKGAVVIDVGAPKGDVDFEQVSERTSFITPVPGGVGPMTVICLLENVFMAAAMSTLPYRSGSIDFQTIIMPRNIR